MIRVAEPAREHIRRLLAEAGTSQDGLRISATEEQDGELTCEMQVVDHPEPADVIVETQRVRLFLNRQAVEALDQAELTLDNDELALALPEAVAT